MIPLSIQDTQLWCRRGSNSRVTISEAVYLETEIWLYFLAETKCVSFVWMQHIYKGWVVFPFYLSLIVEIEKNNLSWEQTMIQNSLFAWNGQPCLEDVSTQMTVPPQVVRKSWQVAGCLCELMQGSLFVLWSRSSTALVGKWCGVPGEVYSAKPGLPLLLLKFFCGELIFRLSKGNRERHSETKSLPPVVAEPVALGAMIVWGAGLGTAPGQVRAVLMVTLLMGLELSFWTPFSHGGHYVSSSGWREKDVRQWHRNHLVAWY